MFYSRPTRCSDGMNNLVLRLPVRPYSGLVGEAASPPVCFLISIKVGFLPLGCCFLLGLFQHIGLLVKNWGLCSVIEGSPLNFWCICLELSGGGSEVVDEDSLTVTFRARYSGFCSTQYYWHLHCCLRFICRLTSCLAARLWVINLP